MIQLAVLKTPLAVVFVLHDLWPERCNDVAEHAIVDNSRDWVARRDRQEEEISKSEKIGTNLYLLYVVKFFFGMVIK